MPLKLVWPIVVVVLAIIGYVVIKGSDDSAPVEGVAPVPGPSSAAWTAEPESVPGSVATDARSREWSAPEEAGQQLTQPEPVSGGVIGNSQPQSGPVAVGPGSSTSTGQVTAGGSGSVGQGAPITESPASPREMGSSGITGSAPESNVLGETGEIGDISVEPDAGENDLDYDAPEAGVPQIEGLPPEASDPGTIGPAPEDSTPPAQ